MREWSFNSHKAVVDEAGLADINGQREEDGVLDGGELVERIRIGGADIVSAGQRFGSNGVVQELA